MPEMTKIDSASFSTPFFLIKELVARDELNRGVQAVALRGIEPPPRRKELSGFHWGSTFLEGCSIIM